MKRREKLIIIFSLITSLTVIFATVSVSAIGYAGKENLTFLFAGLDEGEINTDVICVINYKQKDNRIEVLQIPRDVMYRSDSEIQKINSLYYKSILNGKTKKESMLDFKSVIERIFDIPIIGVGAISAEGFVELVDSVGGVTLELPQSLFDKTEIAKDLTFVQVGTNHLCGSDALKLIRYRQSYKKGDLERLDVQKIFLKGLFQKLTAIDGVAGIFSSLRDNDGLLIEFPLREIFPFLANASRISSADFSVSTIPGRHFIGKDGISYFLVDRDMSIAVLKRMFSKKNVDFDPDKRITNFN